MSIKPNLCNADLTDKVCMITGATSGIGQATAMALAGAGAKVFLVCRNEDKGLATKQKIVKQSGSEKIELLIGDLASLEDVRKIAADFLARNEKLHILINNAGVITTQRQTSKDGFELMFAVNHLAHFLLTNLLLDRMKSSEPARIINVSSGAHGFIKGIKFDDLQSESSFSTMRDYGHSKLCNLLFTVALDNLLNSSRITVNAVHPGAVSTGLGTQNGWFAKLVFAILRPFFRSPEQGAATSVMLATDPKLDTTSGKYFYNCKISTPKPWALDNNAAAELWKVSQKLVQLT